MIDQIVGIIKISSTAIANEPHSNTLRHIFSIFFSACRFLTFKAKVRLLMNIAKWKFRYFFSSHNLCRLF